MSDTEDQFHYPASISGSDKQDPDHHHHKNNNPNTVHNHVNNSNNNISPTRTIHTSGGYLAPDFKRRQLLFDSFARLQNNSNNKNSNHNSNNTNAALTQPNISSLTSSQAASRGTSVLSWGSGFHGQLGLNSSRKRCTVNPAQIDLPFAVQQVCSGGNHSALLSDDGKVYTFGAGQYGQCGNLPRKHNMLPTPHIVDYFVNYKIAIIYIACGQNHSAAISNTNKLYTWGRGKSGALGHGIRADERYPRLVDINYREYGSFIKVKCGAQHTMVLTDRGEVLSFGTGAHGQLGHGTNLDQLRPSRIHCEEWENNQFKIVDIDCGSTMSAAVTETGEGFIWGFAESIFPANCPNIVASPRQIHVPNIMNHNSSSSAPTSSSDASLSEPMIPSQSTAIKQISIGQSHLLLLSHTGDVYTLGSASNLQLGTGAKNNLRVPRLVLYGKEIHSISCGRYHSLAVSSYGIVYSWGCSESGQCGQGSLDSEPFPKIIQSLLTSVVGAISAGSHHSLALSSITHSNVSTDVVNFVSIENEELKLKNELLYDLPNGLKSAHIIQVAIERKNIIAAIADKLRREKLEQANLSEQVKKMIKQTGDISLEVANIGLESNNDENQESKEENEVNVMSIVHDDDPKSRKPVSKPASNQGDNNLQDLTDNPSLSAPPLLLSLASIDHAAESIIKATNSQRGPQSVEPDYEAYKKHNQKVTEKLNLPRINSQRGGNKYNSDSKETENNINSMNNNNNDSTSNQQQANISNVLPSVFDDRSSHRNRILAQSASSPHIATATVTSGPKSSSFSPSRSLNPSQSTALLTQKYLQALNHHSNNHNFNNTNNIQSNRSHIADNNNTTNTQRFTKEMLSNANFAPLAPRIEFIESTSNALSRVKNFISTQPISAQPEFTHFLLKLKQDYNNLKSQVKKKEQLAKKLNNELALSRPNSEEQAVEYALQERMKDLHMKLVTLSTRLSEAEENRANYELYIMRMKEEDLVLSKQCDALKHSILELERQIAKSERIASKLAAQTATVQEEIHKFNGDISNFENFSQRTSDDYRKVLHASVHQSKYAEKLQNNRTKRLDNIKQQAINKLQEELNELNSTQSQYRTELNEWNQKVDEFEKQFRLIASVTGSNNADYIISKWNTNQQITNQIQSEIDEKQKLLTNLKGNIQEASVTLKTLSDNNTPTRWRDIIALENNIGDKQQLLTRRTEESQNWNRRLAQFLEGMQNMTKNARKVIESHYDANNDNPTEINGNVTSLTKIIDSENNNGYSDDIPNNTGTQQLAHQVDITTRETVTLLLQSLETGKKRLEEARQQRIEIQKHKHDLEQQYRQLKHHDDSTVNSPNHTQPTIIPTLEQLTNNNNSDNNSDLNQSNTNENSLTEEQKTESNTSTEQTTTSKAPISPKQESAQENKQSTSNTATPKANTDSTTQSASLVKANEDDYNEEFEEHGQ